MSHPAKGVIEVDCRTAPVPQIGTTFNFRNGQKSHTAKVLRVVKLSRAIPRQMGVVSMVATHQVEFEVPNP